MATLEDKAVRNYLLERGVREDKLPAILRNGVMKKSKKGPIGAIVVRNISGLEATGAVKVVRQFEENVGGKEEVAEKLAVLPDLSDGLRKLVDLIRGGTKKTLAHLIAEAELEPTSVMRAYAKGCVELGMIESAIEAHRNLPRAIKDLVAHALDQTTVCTTCVGSGMVNGKPGQHTDNTPCPACGGSGTSIVSSKHKEWAMDRLLEVTKMRERGGVQVNVNQNNAIVAGGGGGFMEKMLLMSDAVLYPKPKAEVVDAEVVESE